MDNDPVVRSAQLLESYELGEFDQVFATAPHLLEHAEQYNDPQLFAETLFLLGSSQIACRRFPEGEKNVSLAAEQFDRLNKRIEHWRCRTRLAKAWMMNHDFDRGRQQLESIRKESGVDTDDLLEAELLVVEGLLASQGAVDYPTAVTCYTRACELFEKCGQPVMVYTHKKNLAVFLSAQKEFDKAERLLSECIIQLGRLGADRHVLETRINLGLVAARRFQFPKAQALLTLCQEHASERKFEPSVNYRILYNLSLVELALESYSSARKQILRLTDLQEFHLSAAQLGAVQTMLAAVELVLEGPETCDSVLATAAQNMPAYTRDLEWTFAMLAGLCKLSRGDLAPARLELEEALRKPTGADIAVYTRIVHSCLKHLLKGRHDRYAPLAPGSVGFAEQLLNRLKASSPEIFTALQSGPDQRSAPNSGPSA